MVIGEHGTVNVDVPAMFDHAEALWWHGRRDQAVPLLRRLAETGHAASASLLGCWHEAAGEVEEAIRWNRVAADQGWETAMINLALLIEDTDREEAVRLLRHAAEIGTDPLAKHNLGVFMEEDGFLAEAERWYRDAARVPLPQARDRLGRLLQRTDRVLEAEAWYRRALDDDKDTDWFEDPEDEDYETYTLIMFDLAGLLERTGRRQEARGWYRRAAAREDAEAGSREPGR